MKKKITCEKRRNNDKWLKKDIKEEERREVGNQIIKVVIGFKENGRKRKGKRNGKKQKIWKLDFL